MNSLPFKSFTVFGSKEVFRQSLGVSLVCGLGLFVGGVVLGHAVSETKAEPGQPTSEALAQVSSPRAEQARYEPMSMPTKEAVSEGRHPQQAFTEIKRVPVQAASRVGVNQFSQSMGASMMDLRDRAQHPDPAVRVQSVEWIADVGTEEDLSLLTEAAYWDSDESVRVAALSSLVELAMYVPTEELINAMNDPSDAVRASALAHLAILEPDEALPYLYDAIYDANDTEKVALLKQLRAAGDAYPLSEYVSSQKEVAQYDPNPRQRVRALERLGQMGTPEALEALIEAQASSTHPYVRGNATRIIRENL